MRTNNSRAFKDLVSVYKATEFNPTLTGGTIEVTSEELCLCIKEIIEQHDDFGITLESGTLAVGQKITVHISSPRIKFGQLHSNFDNYLKNDKNRIKEAKNYYIINEKYFNNDDVTPEHITKYKLLLRLVVLFKECSAYLDETNSELVFVESSVTKIPVSYDSSILKKIDAEKIKHFIASFTDDTHKEQKLTILANTIKSMSETKNKDVAFAYLISDFTQLCESYNKGYNLFVSGFSYDKILDQLRVAKIEEMGKIHKVFSDIQNQILGIPVATIIVATQMKLAVGWDSQALINTAVVLGSLFFTAMIIFVIFNQWQTLNAISDELLHKKNQAETKYKSIYADIEATFSSLRTRIRTQKIVFFTLAVFVLVGIILTIKVYFFLTPYAHEYIF